MVYTEQEIEDIVSKISGTWVKRRNARKKLAAESNNDIYEKIAECKGKIRDLKALGAKEQALRDWYAEITQLELKILW